MLAVTVATDSGELLNHAAAVFRAWRQRLGELFEAGGLGARHAALLASACCIPERAHDLPNLSGLQCMGNPIVNAVARERDSGWSEIYLCVRTRVVTLSARVPELGKVVGTILVDGLCDGPVFVDDAVITAPQVEVSGYDGSSLGDDDRRAAASAFAMIGDELRGVLAIAGEAGLVGGVDDPVLQRDRTNSER